jgi:glycosyltransferase involved in cell wall biosynthesis
LAVIEVVNNWVCEAFEETYRPPLVGERIAHVLRAVQPDVVHVHSLLNLSFDLPALAQARGIPVVATLHDYTLVCPSGGQRIHRAEEYVCEIIDTERCARCFRQSPFAAQASFGRLAGTTAPGPVGRAAAHIGKRMPRLRDALTGALGRVPVFEMSSRDFDRRLDAARRVFKDVDLFVSPSPSLASEFERLGIERSRIRVSDYGSAPLIRGPRHPAGGPLRIGYVGTLVWHKGVHVLVDAVRSLPPAAYELKIFGDPDVFASYTADLRARAAGLPVRFMGAFNRDRTPEVYGQFDAIVVPSLWLENSPLVIHEAFMAGVPVVAARIGGIVDLVEDGRTGLLYEATSAAALAAALRSLIEHPDRLDALTEGAWTVPPVKSIAQDAREWEAIYGEVVARGQTARVTR